MNVNKINSSYAPLIFTVETSPTDKICRVVNNILYTLSLYLALTQPAGILFHASRLILTHKFASICLGYITYSVVAALVVSRFFTIRVPTIVKRIASRLLGPRLPNTPLTIKRISTLFGQKASFFIEQIVKQIFYVLRIELDGIGAAEKLGHLKIKQIVIQRTLNISDTGDGAIPDRGTLLHDLSSNDKSKVLLLDNNIRHGDQNYPKKVELNLNQEIKRFLK